MKAVRLRKSKIPEYTELSDIVLNKDDWVKVKVKAVGLCGSDIQKITSNDNPSNYSGIEVLGHEFSGCIEEVGISSNGLKVGDRVVVNPLIPCYSCNLCKEKQYQLCTNLNAIGRTVQGAFAEYVAAPSKNIRKISERLSYETAALTDVVAVAIHNYHLSDSPKNKDILIYGDGPIAITCLQIYKEYRNKISLIGKHKKNLELSKLFGATPVEISGVNELKSNNYDMVIESVGRNQEDTIRQAIRLVKPKGKIIVTGVFEKGYEGKIPFRDLFYKEAILLGSNSYSIQDNKNEFDIALEMLEKKVIDLSEIITHILPLKKFNEGLKLIKNKEKSGAIKIIYKP